jgi:hypothetical protein
MQPHRSNALRYASAASAAHNRVYAGCAARFVRFLFSLIIQSLATMKTTTTTRDSTSRLAARNDQRELWYGA